MPSGAFANVNWSATDFDTDNIFDVGHPERLTFSTPGYYNITAAVSWPPGGGTQRGLRLFLDDGVTATLVAEDWRTPLSGEDTTQSLSVDVLITEADVESDMVDDRKRVKLQAMQDSGGSLSIGGVPRTFISVRYLESLGV